MLIFKAGSILNGFCTVYILPFNEEYEVTFPNVYAKGLLFGTLLMELGGSGFIFLKVIIILIIFYKVSIICKKTEYRAEIEFKQKPLIGKYKSYFFLK